MSKIRIAIDQLQPSPLKLKMWTLVH